MFNLMYSIQQMHALIASQAKTLTDKRLQIDAYR